jgi:predicted transposase/invertase (TIGR01784 family)
MGSPLHRPVQSLQNSHLLPQLPNPANIGYIVSMSSVTNPHDHVFRQTFGQPEVAAGYFRHNLPEELLEHIDLETLERTPDTFVDPELHPSASDLLYTVDWSPARNSGASQGKEKLLLYLLLEHKSYADPLAVFQLLRYMVRIWEKHCGEHPKAATLPPVYPMIIYHGARPWRHPVNFHSLFTVQEPALLARLPEFTPVLQDFSRLDDQDIRGGVSARTVLLILKHVFRDDLSEQLPKILAQAQEMLENENGREIIFTLLYYLTEGTGKLDEETLGTVLENSVHGGDIMQSFLKKYYNQGLEQGVQQGIQQGVQQGIQQGVQQGMQQGVMQGELRVLSRLLRKRFGELPEWAEQMLKEASGAMLEVWSERVLTAAALEDVFAE